MCLFKGFRWPVRVDKDLLLENNFSKTCGWLFAATFARKPRPPNQHDTGKSHLCLIGDTSSKRLESSSLSFVSSFRGLHSYEPRKKPSDTFPYTGSLIFIIPIYHRLGRISSPQKTLNNQGPFFHCSWLISSCQIHLSKKSPTGPTGPRTPKKPEYPIAFLQLTERGPLGSGPIQFLMESAIFWKFICKARILGCHSWRSGGGSSRAPADFFPK